VSNHPCRLSDYSLLQFLPERVDVPTSRQLSRHQLREVESAPNKAHDSSHPLIATHGRQSKSLAQYTTQLQADIDSAKTSDTISASRLSGFKSAHVLPTVKREQMNVVSTSLRHTMSAVLDTSLHVKGLQAASKAHLQAGAASAAAYAASNAAAAQQAAHDRDQVSADLSKQLDNEQLKDMIAPSSRALQAPGR